MTRHWLVGALALMFATSCAAAGSTALSPESASAQPYAGLQVRPIKALAPDRVEDLLAGRGAGYAMAAELNHHPGPRHVLDLAAELGLQPDQESQVRESFVQMEREAQRHGQTLVELETELDRAFASGAATDEEVRRLTAAIAAVEGQLRATHLTAHLTVRNLLKPEQVETYARLRGYTADPSSPPAGHQTGHHGAGLQRH